MTRIAGAGTDLAARIGTHLFVLCPNNSGSTFLSKALATSRAVWSLHREGQHVYGYAGPCSIDFRDQSLSWAASAELRAIFEDGSAYDWEKIRRAWYFQATASDAGASVFVQKSPPHLLIPHLLDAAFANARFLMMVRHPYATVEGIARRKLWTLDRADKIGLAAEHVLVCLQRQRRNRARYGDRGVFFTYEEMCANPEGTAARIVALVPELEDLTFDQVIPIKNRYVDRVRDFNAEQVARLSGEDRRIIRAVFDTDPEAMAAFGYEHI